MRSHSRATKSKIKFKDSKKEAIFKELSQRLQDAGHAVRRERLKTGHGWKVVSGACRAQQSSYVFVDSRLSQDDQIVFLRSKLRELGLSDLVSDVAA